MQQQFVQELGLRAKAKEESLLSFSLQKCVCCLEKEDTQKKNYRLFVELCHLQLKNILNMVYKYIYIYISRQRQNVVRQIFSWGGAVNVFKWIHLLQCSWGKKKKKKEEESIEFINTSLCYAVLKKFRDFFYTFNFWHSLTYAKLFFLYFLKKRNTLIAFS